MSEDRDVNFRVRLKGEYGEVELEAPLTWAKYPTGNKAEQGQAFLIDEAIRLYRGLDHG